MALPYHSSLIQPAFLIQSLGYLEVSNLTVGHTMTVDTEYTGKLIGVSARVIHSKTLLNRKPAKIFTSAKFPLV